MNVTVAPNPFLVLWKMGYRHLTPITPPLCELAPGSAINARGGDARGKAPGVRGRDGLWRGHDFVGYHPDENDLDRWFRMGGGVGLVCSDGLRAIDADCLDETDAETVAREIEDRFGILPCRIGRAPKRLYVLRTDPSFPYCRLTFGSDGTSGAKQDRVEILGEKRQFVAHGVHPGTMAPYRWVRRLPPASEIAYVEPAALLGFMEALRDLLPKANAVERSGAERDVDPEDLRGPPEIVRAAVRAIPNTSALFPTRESYVGMGMAIKAAMNGEPDSGFDVFAEWCSRWDGGDNDPEVVANDWRRMKPTRRGASWLYELAETHGGGAFSRAAAWHEEIADDKGAESIFGPDEPPNGEPAALGWSDGWALAESDAPPQRWLVESWIPARTVSLLYGDGGVGKSLAALQLCWACASGGTWLGLKAASGPALFVTAEDEKDEIHRRLRAISRADGCGQGGAKRSALAVFSLEGEEAELAVFNAKSGRMEPTALYRRLEATLRELRPVVCVLDTLADIFGGDEIKRLQARQFIRLMTRLMTRMNFEISVVIPAHPSLTGINTGSGSSGSTGWSNSVRSRLYLRRVFSDDEGRVEPDPDMRVLEGKKTNRSRAGGALNLRWSAGRFAAVDAATVAAALDEDALEHEEAFLAALDETRKAGRDTSDNDRARNYAPRSFAELACAGRSTESNLRDAMNRLFAKGEIYIETYGKPSNPHKRLSRKTALSSDIFG